MSWSTGGVYDKPQIKPKRRSDVALRCHERNAPLLNLNESMPSSYQKPKLLDSLSKARKDITKKGSDLLEDMKAHMAEQDEKHKAQVVELEEQWKGKVKQVLHISHERITGAEEKLRLQMEENEALARSNSRLKESVDMMKGHQAIYQDVKSIGKELKLMRKQISSQKDLVIDSKKEIEQINAGLLKVLEDRALLTSLSAKMTKADRKLDQLDHGRKEDQELNGCKDSLLVLAAGEARWRRLCTMEAAIAMSSIFIFVFLWRRR